MKIVYNLFTTFLYPILILFIYLRRYWNKEDKIRFKEKIFPSSFKVNRKKSRKLIWFHAASIGEVKSILPIINKLNNKFNNFEYLITTVTLSSANLISKNLHNFKNVHHRFFPLDVDFLVKKFLSSWKPNIIFLVDSEIWPNLIFNIKKKKIPLALINARITKKTYKKWKIFSNFSKGIFDSFDLCLTSNSETKKFLQILGAKKVFFCGNIKLINSININKIKNRNIKNLIKKKFWVAASTHDGEESFCLKTHNIIKRKYKEIVTVIAPRHINRAKKIEDLCKKMNLSYQTIKEGDVIKNHKEVIIVNAFGILNEYFKFAKSVFVGKSLNEEFKNISGQSPIEAATLGCKIYHGPYVYNFQEIYQILHKNKISYKINTTNELAYRIIDDNKSKYKKKKIFSKLMRDISDKILKRVMENLSKFLKNENIKA